ncbi:hypothetical protein FQN54_009388 [Arachnomyces sp. PD_36]|nr:hypothetical protein FQN54_009388 [Arachnomyces sp. PD_36]
MALSQAAESAWKIIPQFQTISIEETVRFYTEELGFTLGGTYPDEEDADGNPPKPTFCSIAAGHKAAANIYFFLCKPGEFHTSSTMIALGTDELDEFYGLLNERGVVRIVAQIKDEEWGYRQFAIEDNSGNKLTFFKFLEGGNPGVE